VTFHSDHFKDIFGSTAPESGFHNWLQDSDGFSAWLAQQKMALMSGCLQPPTSIEYGAVKLQNTKLNTPQDMFLTIRFPGISPTGGMDSQQFVQEGHYKVSARLDEMTCRRARRWMRRQRQAQLPSVLREAQALGAQGSIAALQLLRDPQQLQHQLQQSSVVGL